MDDNLWDLVKAGNLNSIVPLFTDDKALENDLINSTDSVSVKQSQNRGRKLTNTNHH
jgi:ankyrin repeat protein